MKKILFRKLLADYISFFLLALLSTGVIIWVFQAVNYLDIMIEDGRDYLVYINFSLLNFPKTISKIYKEYQSLEELSKESDIKASKRLNLDNLKVKKILV